MSIADFDKIYTLAPRLKSTEDTILYAAPDLVDGSAWFGFLRLKVKGGDTKLKRPFVDTFTTDEGFYLFAAQAPSDKSYYDFVHCILNESELQSDDWPRACVWVADFRPESFAIQLPLQFSRYDSRTQSCDVRCRPPSYYHLNIGSNLSLQVGGTSKTFSIAISGTGDSLAINGRLDSDRAEFLPLRKTGLSVSKSPGLEIRLEGPYTGCLTFGAEIDPSLAFPYLHQGLRYCHGSADGSASVTQDYPVLNQDNATVTEIGCQATIDPLDPTNASRTQDELAQGRLRSLLVLSVPWPSWLRTSTNQPITLVPLLQTKKSEDGWTYADAGALVFENATPGCLPMDAKKCDVSLVPVGRFAMQVGAHGIPDPSADKRPQLLCGLSGTETVGFLPHAVDKPFDTLRFVPKQAAYVPKFPLPQVSPVGPPVDPEADVLDPAFKTSWVSILSATDECNPYVAQPKGSSLYGHDEVVHPNHGTLFGHKATSTLLPKAELDFPLAPYAGVQVATNPLQTDCDESDSASAAVVALETFESQVIAATRRNRIAGKMVPISTRIEPATSDPYNVTTPTGRIFTLEGPESATIWDKILLGQIDDPRTKTTQQVYFCKPDEKLQQAFQTSDLFLVAASTKHLGAPAGAGIGDCPDGPEFYNELEMGGWKLDASVGQKNQYADYRNVLIVKGRKGKLYDPEDPQGGSLVSSPRKWTQCGDFAPAKSAKDQTPDPNQLTILAQWLQDFFADAWKQPDTDYFRKFNTLATDPNWTGVLILKVDIAKVPDDLAGIVAGVDDMSRFFAHHLGIEMNQVVDDTIGPDLNGSSSVFGLIHYLDPNFQPPKGGEPIEPIPPKAGATYDFRLLSLKVLFANSSVKSFQSYAQVTLGELFGMPVTGMGDPKNLYRSIVLRGSFQKNNGKAVYSLGSASDSQFLFDHNIIDRIDVPHTQMSTRSTGSDGKKAVSWFGLQGVIDFKAIDGQTDEDTTVPESGPAKVIVRNASVFVCDLGVKYEDGTKSEGTYTVDKATGTYTFLDAVRGKKAVISYSYQFDIFSFGDEQTGATDGKGLPQGLNLSNIGLEMSYPPDQPDKKSFVLQTGGIRFDLATSTARKTSLFNSFALEFEGFVEGTEKNTPASQDFLPVLPDARLSGVDGGPWYGLKYKLDMGTPGALAGKVCLVSHLLLAWSPDSRGDNYKAMIGIKLPGTGGGAKLISLQSVMKLSIGQIRLAFDGTKNSFLLMLTEIALKFLGLLKIPPNGSTLFYLFGDPDSKGQPSKMGWYAMYHTPTAKMMPIEADGATTRVEGITS